jgi:hypothetical protein
VYLAHVVQNRLHAANVWEVGQGRWASAGRVGKHAVVETAPDFDRVLPAHVQVSGAAMAYAFLGERWGPMGWAGAAVILAASVACQLGGAFEEDGGKGPGKEDAIQEA